MPSLQSAEQSNSHTDPGSLGHEEQAVPHRHRDQGVGHRLLCTAEAVHWTPAQVSHFFIDVHINEDTLSHQLEFKLHKAVLFDLCLRWGFHNCHDSPVYRDFCCIAPLRTEVFQLYRGVRVHVDHVQLCRSIAMPLLGFVICICVLIQGVLPSCQCWNDSICKT